jgi:hypothetical protein
MLRAACCQPKNSPCLFKSAIRNPQLARCLFFSSGCGFGQELSGLFGVGWNGFGLAP